MDYIVAPPQMAHYMQVSAQVYQIYLRCVSPEDICVYSWMRFLLTTGYLATYRDRAPAGRTDDRSGAERDGHYGDGGHRHNLYLSKIMMDIVAKHMEPDANGVRIAELGEEYREQLWDHRPITDFWRVGCGTARRLASTRPVYDGRYCAPLAGTAGKLFEPKRCCIGCLACQRRAAD